MKLPFLDRLYSVWHLLHELREQLDSVQMALGRVEARQTENLSADALPEAEFKVYSQWGEDGLIEHMLRQVPIDRKVFVEFGVQDYRESNTRFLLKHRNWSGLVLDGSPDNVRRIREDVIYWQHNLKAECAFVSRENINKLISAHGIEGDIGLLSIDIDGNDYWVWQAINVISPRIVIVEYNALFGPEAPVSIPYDETFVRSRAHYSNLYWGCSLAALNHMAAEKGYVLAGCNSNGNNAFFVRKDVSKGISVKTVEAAFRRSLFRESRNQSGELTYLSPERALLEIQEQSVVQVRTGETMAVGDAVVDRM